MKLAIFSALGLAFGLVTLALSWRSRKWRRGALIPLLLALVGLVVALLGALGGVIGLASRGYARLTQEDLIATVETRPIGKQRFKAKFVYADGGVQSYELSGDALYVDAHIVKWDPLVNILGLHTSYRLDRVAGRYDDLGQENRADPSAHALGTESRLDLFELARAVAPYVPVVDAQYGSATFVPADKPATHELRVSTSGLLFRPVRPPVRPPGRPPVR